MAAKGSLNELLTRIKRSLSTQGSTPDASPRTKSSKPEAPAKTRSKRTTSKRTASRPAQTTELTRNGGIDVSYAPERDGDADPGEVAWAWVPYEDDPQQGKDRPVLVIGFDQQKRLAAVPLSSRDPSHRRDAHEWIPVGTGAWDSQRRPSFADASRLLRYAPAEVRREGAALDRARYEAVLERVSAIHGWKR